MEWLCPNCRGVKSKTWTEFQWNLYICSGGYYKESHDNLQNISNVTTSNWMPFATYTHYVPDLCLEILMSTVLSSLEGLGGNKLDCLSTEAPSIVSGHTGNNDMEDEFKSECLVIKGLIDICLLS